MHRISFAAILSLAVLLSGVQFSFAADTTQSSSNNQCPAPSAPTSVYAGISKPASYTIPDPADPEKTIKVTNLSHKSCTQSCSTDGGGTISGTCLGPNDCRAETTCSGQAPQKVTTQQIQDALNGTQGGSTNGGNSVPSANAVVSQDFQNLTAAQAPSADQTTAPTTGGGQPVTNIPTTSPSPSWLSQFSGTPTPGPALPYANQSLFTQAYNSLEGNAGNTSPSLNTSNPISVPTTPEQYLQASFGTNPNGTMIGTNGPINTNYLQYEQTLPSGNQAFIIPANDPLNQQIQSNAPLANSVTGSDFSIVAKLPDGSLALLPGNQYGIPTSGYAGVVADGLTDTRLQGTGINGLMTSLGLSPAPQPVDEKLTNMLEGQTFGAASVIFNSQNPTTGVTAGQDVGQLMNDSAQKAGILTVLSDNLGLGGPMMNVAGMVTDDTGKTWALTTGQSQPIPFSDVAPPPTPTTNTETPPTEPVTTTPPTPQTSTYNGREPTLSADISVATPEDIKAAEELGIKLPTMQIPGYSPAPTQDQSGAIVASDGQPLPATVPATPPNTPIEPNAAANSEAVSSPDQNSKTPPPLDQGAPAKATETVSAQDGSQKSNPQGPAEPGSGQGLQANPQPAGGAGQAANPQPGGATGGNPTNTGGNAGQGNQNAILSLLSGLLGGIGAQTPTAPAAVQSTRPIVYSSTQPIVSLPTTANGLQENCANGACGATSLAKPALVSYITYSTPTLNQQISNKDQAGGQATVQTIIPGSAEQAPVGSPQPGNSSGSAQASAGQPSGAGSQIPSSATEGGQNGNNTPLNPSGTQQGPSGAVNSSGSQQGGVGAQASTPGNGSAQQVSNSSAGGQSSGKGAGVGTGGTGPSAGASGNPTSQTQQEQQNQSGQNATTNCQTLSCWASQQLNNLKYAAEHPGATLADLFSVGAANASPGTAQLLNQLKAASDALNAAAQRAKDLGQTEAALTPLKAAIAQAQVMVNLSKQLLTSAEIDTGYKASISAIIGDVQAKAAPIQQLLSQYDNSHYLDGTSKAIGDKMAKTFPTAIPAAFQAIQHLYNTSVEAIQHPSPTVGSIASLPSNQPTAVPIAKNAVNEPNPNPLGNPAQNNPVPAAAQPTGLVAKAAPFNGAASVYDCRLGGINGNCAQSGTGGFVNPAEYSAALQLDLAKAFRTGTGTGNVGYALVESVDTGRQMIVRVNDNGPLTPGRVIDLSPASMNCLGYGICTNDSTFRSQVLQNVKVTLLQGSYTPGLVANGVLPSGAPCGYRGCAAPTPNSQVATARVSGLTSVPNCANQSGLCAADPTTGAAFTCQGDQTSCVGSFQQQLSLSRLCANNAATCGANVSTYALRSNGAAPPGPEPRRVIAIQSNYGTMGKMASNPNVPIISGISNQDFINRMRAAGVPVQDMSSASLANYPRGTNQMAALMWHGSGTGGADSGLVQTEINQNNNGQPAAQMVLQRDGTLVVVAPVDALSFHAATTNQMGPGIEIQGLTNQGDDPTPAQIQTMQKITDVAMNQLGWQVGTHGIVEPGHRDQMEAGPSTINYVYGGIAPGPVPTYQLLDQNGQPVLNANGQPLTTTQAPAADGTGKFLTNADGSPMLDANGKPIPVTPVPVAQDQNDPTKYNAPDDRPEQPKPVNPWPRPAGYPYQTASLTAAPVGQLAPMQQVQPPYQMQQQPIQQPLPQPSINPQINPNGTSSIPGTPVAAVAIVANPMSVQSGGTSRVSWSSVGVSSCAVTTSSGFTIGTTTKGSVLSPKLSTTTEFTAQCETLASSTVATSTSVIVQ